MIENKRKLKYLSSTILFQEIPDEISLCINVSGCPYQCKGCHSKGLWEYDGNYVSDDLDNLIDEYKDYISNVVFMGGDQNMSEFTELVKRVKERGYKASVYSGSDDFRKFDGLLEELDWIKIGSYKQELTVEDNICHNVKLATSNQKLLKKGVDY